MYQQLDYRFSPGYSCSSGVSTPAMTPPPVNMLDALMQPSWMKGSSPADALMAQIVQSQQQTARLVEAHRQLTMSQQMYYGGYGGSGGSGPIYYPTMDQLQGRGPFCGQSYSAPFSGQFLPPTPPPPQVVSDQQSALHAAQTVLAQAGCCDSEVLARAVVAAAGALVQGKSGNLSNLRAPVAVRAQTPAWISHADTATESSGVVLAQYNHLSPSRTPPASPTPTESPINESSTLAEVVAELKNETPYFGPKTRKRVESGSQTDTAGNWVADN